jgi:RimJ/RimL family protein N-acetyltransferase
VIKKLTKHHHKEYKQIRLEALKKSPDSFLSSFEEENKTPDDVWAKQLENSLKFGYFINDEIVGCTGLLIEKIAKISHTGTLFGMYVKDDCRGAGIGLALVNFVKDYAKKNHIKHLYLGCNAQNLGAVKLYKKCGFKVYGTRPDYTKIGSQFYDDLIMMCEL